MNQENTLIERQKRPIKLALIQMKEVGGELDPGWTHPSSKIMANSVPGGKTFKHLAAAARQNQIYVVAGIVEKDWKNTYNTAVLIAPDGKEALQAPNGADADTIIYIDVETRERPAWGTDWKKYWERGK